MPTEKYLKIFMTHAPFAVAAFIAGLLADHWLDSKPIGTAVGVAIAIAIVRKSIKAAYSQGFKDGQAANVRGRAK